MERWLDSINPLISSKGSLIKAGKTFDFLPVPGLGHSDGGPYGKIKKRDFFVQHLLHIMPPDRNTNELNPAK